MPARQVISRKYFEQGLPLPIPSLKRYSVEGGDQQLNWAFIDLHNYLREERSALVADLARILWNW